MNNPQNQESLFYDYIRRLEHHRQGREMVHFHLSKLRPFNRREHHIRVAADAFEPMVKDLLGQIFVFENADIIFVFKTEAMGSVEQAIEKVKFLFGDDPLFETRADGQNQYCSWYDIESDYDSVVAQARSMVETSKSGGAGSGGAADIKAALKAKQDQGERMTPRTLDRVIEALKLADLTNMVRRQYICTVEGPQMVPTEKFSELFISISDLRETLLPGVNLTSSPWLFQHLTETLDRRVLSLLSRTEDRDITGNISINLNVATLLSAEFLKFDENVIAAMRGNIVLELQQLDIFSDLNSYLFAREFVRERGYQICIDGVNYKTLPFIDRERLGADTIKLIWSQDIVEGGHDLKDKVIRQIMLTGPQKIILSRCDTEESIEFGRENGILYFQGRQVESLIAEEERRRNMRTLKRRTEANDKAAAAKKKSLTKRK
jgi:EAL domain-containing protein (putative c-di-GMP-specific phosphodiesterase class I)